MEILSTVLFGFAAFWVGAFPFSVLIGRWFLGKDITDYGDGNPGAANVFRAGGQKLGVLAVILDVAKGVPFVYLAHTNFDLPALSVVIVGMCAIAGHAFSPFLQWRGGKAVAVTYGVLVALPYYDMLTAVAAFMVIGFLFIEANAWTVMFGALASLAYLVVTKGSSWETLLMLYIVTIFAIKHFEELRSLPGFNGRLVRWLRAVLRGALLTI